MTFGFLEHYLDTRSCNGRDDILLSDLHFRDVDGKLYMVPAGADTDGGSTPRPAWLIPGFEPTGRHWFDWILHDSGYRGTLLVLENINYVPAQLTRLQSDELLDRSLKIRGASWARRSLVFRTLRATGWRHFKP